VVLLSVGIFKWNPDLVARTDEESTRVMFRVANRNFQSCRLACANRKISRCCDSVNRNRAPLVQLLCFRTSFPPNTQKIIPTFNEVKPILEQANCCFKGRIKLSQGYSPAGQKGCRGQVGLVCRSSRVPGKPLSIWNDEEKSWSVNVNEQKRLKLWDVTVLLQRYAT